MAPMTLAPQTSSNWDATKFSYFWRPNPNLHHLVLSDGSPETPGSKGVARGAHSTPPRSTRTALH